MKQPELSIIIPAYNEGVDFGPRMLALATYLKTHHYDSVEILVMMQTDDTSGDVAIEHNFERHHPAFRTVNLGKRAGKGGAVRAGMFEAKGSYRMFMDADLATPLHHLEDVRGIIHRRAKVGIGIRDLVSSHKDVLRKFITQFGNILAQVILLPGIKDTQCGFKVFEARAAEEIFSRQTITGWGFDLEILAIARHFKYTVETFRIDDWADPKLEGLVGDSAAKAAVQVFRDLVNIRWGLIIGRYKNRSFHYASNQKA